MKCRDRTEITAQILAVAESGASQTMIMYRAFLTYDQMKEYLDLLTKYNLLKCEERRYKTTEKGRRFLKLYNEVARFMSLYTESQ